MVIKKLFFFCMLVGVSLSLPVSLKRVTKGFKIAKMQLDILARNEWDVASDLSEEELAQILNQPFSYLDRGAQCYVFESQDGKYVVKFFRFDRCQNSSNQKNSPLEKIEHMFTASVLAFTRAKEETGVLYIHLNRTVDQLPVFFARGPTYQGLSLPLDEYRFVIQKKVEPFRSSLVDAYKKGDDEAMVKMIDSFLATLRSRTAKGLRNSDPAMSRNFGFLDGKAIEIDFGNYSANGISDQWEISRYTYKLRSFLSENAPEWVSYLDQKTM